MSSELQLDGRHLNRWRRHLVNAYEVNAGMVWRLLQVKLCDPFRAL